jgi:hypothetical protein
MQPGQSLQLQVVQLQPELAFIIVPTTTPVATNPASIPQLQASPLLYLNPQLLANQQVKSMDINFSLDSTLQNTSPLSANNALNLTLNQVLAAKVVDTQIMQNTIALSIGDKTVQVQAQPAITLQAGQSLQLQVVKLLPSPEFKIISSGTSQTASPNNSAASNPQILRLLNQQPANLTAAGPGNNRSPANVVLSQLAPGQQLQATLLSISGGKLSFEITSTAPATSPPPAGSAAGNALTSVNATQSASLQTTQFKPSANSEVKTNQLITLDAKQLILVDTENPATSLNKATTAVLSQLTPGSQITLQVVKAGAAPVFTLALPDKTPVLTEQNINQLLKQLLPRQASAALLLNQLQLTLPNLQNSASVAETLKQLAQEILAAIPPQTQLSVPEQIKHSIDQSGLFLEAKLAELLSGQGGAAFQDDMKAKLVKFVALLKLEIAAQTQPSSEKQSGEILKELLQKADSALAKLTLDQINSLPKEELPKQTWSLELPFFFQDLAHSLHIEIEQDKPGGKHNNQEQAQKYWAVSITLSPPELGTIHCRISCYDGAVNTRFWSENPATVANIADHLDYLKNQFELKGLTTGFMEAQQGKPTATQIVKQALASLLNEKV